ncbi:MAG: carboxypeptidase regulatory-like domain-containing protein, partial [Acidobacteriales bacterium]
MKIHAFLLAIILLPSVAPAQSLRGAVTGTVIGASGAPIFGAAVQLVHTDTNRIRNGSTDEQGAFAISNLPPGEYRIEAHHDGHRKHVQRITLRLNQEIQVGIPLLPGQRTDAVEVTAALEPLRTNSAALGGVIENVQITGLPLDGRNFYELSLLLPGVAPPAPGSAGSVRGEFAVNVNGAREDSNNFLLDGVFNGDPQLNGVGVTPPVDAVREFEVATSTYDA